MPIKNLRKAALRIKKAIKNQERIILYGDSDLDGASAVLILKEAIELSGGQAAVNYFPNRSKEGYGLNLNALKNLKSKSPALLILLDCGITNFKEIKMAKKEGFDVMIIDHHVVLGKLPPANIVVNPKQSGDRHDFKQLATAGLALNFAFELLGKNSQEITERNFFEIAALATIADMMPQIKDNKLIIEKGLSGLKRTTRIGLKAFFKLDKKLEKMSFGEVAQKMVAILNASEVKNHINMAYSLLAAQDEKTAYILAKDLTAKKVKKQLMIKKITNEVEELISKKPNELIIFEGKNGWSHILLGAVASRICNKFKKPVFLVQRDFNKNEGIALGAIRAPQGMDVVKAMRSCARLLRGFAGHPVAAGFNLELKNVEAFKNGLIKYFSKIE